MIKKARAEKNGSKIYFCLLILILGVAAFLRLYNFPYRYGLGEETVRDAVIGIEAARELQLPLTGAFSSLGPFTFGPLYAYQLALATLIFRSVYSPWIYLTLVSILYVWVIYKVGKMLLGKEFGLLLAFFAAISPPQIISATHLTSHNLTNIFAILAVWLFLTLLEKTRSNWWGLILGITIGIGLNLHYQMIGLLILPLLLVSAKKKNWPYLITALTGIFITFVPLLIFELNNHWFNVRNMLDFVISGRKRIYVPNRWLFYVRDFWPGFWADTFGIPLLLGKVTMLTSAAVLAVAYFRKKLTKPITFLLIAFLVNFVILRYYWGERFYGYLNFLRPYVFIFTGYSFYFLGLQKFGKYAALILLVAFTVLPLPRIRHDLARDSFSQTMLEQADQAEQKLGNTKYQIYDCGLTYEGAYNAKVLAQVFLAELHQKFSPSEAKIGLWRQGCRYPKALLPPEKQYPRLNEMEMTDLTSATEETLREAGWRAVSFRIVYDQYARWWFQLQP